MVIVPPIPIRLLVVIVAFSKIHVVAMRVVFPLVVVNDLAVPPVVVMVIGVINARVHRATRHEYGKSYRRSERKRAELPFQRSHPLSFRVETYCRNALLRQIPIPSKGLFATMKSCPRATRK